MTYIDAFKKRLKLLSVFICAYCVGMYLTGSVSSWSNESKVAFMVTYLFIHSLLDVYWARTKTAQ